MFLYRIRISRIGLSQSVVILIDAKGSFEKKKKKIESMTFEIYTIIMCKKKKKEEELRVLLFRLECYNFIRLDTDRKEKKEEICNKYLYIFSQSVRYRFEGKKRRKRRRRKKKEETRGRMSN